MSKRKNKSLFGLLSVLTTSFLTIGASSIVVTSCGNDKPVPTDTIKITFDSNGGELIKNGSAESIEVSKGTTWSKIKNKYSAFKDDDHPFIGWSINKIDVLDDDDYQFNEAKTLYALYHEHDYSIYGVNEETHRVYVKCSTCQELHYLTDQELQDDKFKNKLLVKRKDGDNFTWELTSNSIEQEIETPMHIGGDLVSTIYMMNGVYDIGGYISSGTVIANLYGVTTENHEKLTTINCCTGNPISMPGVELHINNSYMLGALENIGRAFYFGLQPNKLYCDNCYFLGQQTVYAGYGEFKNCTFDSSVFELYQDELGSWRTEYSLYLYNTIDRFEQCTFIGKGKAVKIYSEGQKYNSDFTFIDINFIWVIDDESKLLPDQFKACIEIDSTYQSAEDYIINYKNLQQEERRPSVSVQLFNDKSTHSQCIEIN